MKRLLLLILSLILLTGGSALGESAYEHWIPDGAVELSQIDAGGLKILTYELAETGEQLTLTADTATGEMRMLYGMCAALSEGTPLGVEASKALLAGVYPDALVVSSAEETLDIGIVRKLNVFAPTFYGHVLFDADGICGRDITIATCMQDGRLNMQGAVSVLKLLRPEAALSDIELDDDDGILLYEGNAYQGGVEYEFELDAYTGQLLQWDRD